MRNTKLYTLILLGGLGTLCLARGQAGLPAEPPPPAAPAPSASPAPAVTIKAASPGKVRTGSSARAGVNPPNEPFIAQYGAHGEGGIEEFTIRSGGDRAFAFADGPVNRGRSLIIRSPETDSKKAEELEEDLSVMARILDKATDQKSDNPMRKAMGITLMTFGGGRSARNIYLDGYGVLFFVNVPFPLIAPTEKPVEPASKEKQSSDWEEAKNEVYGTKRGNLNITKGEWDGGRMRYEEYDAQKVTDLKENVIRALKNAVHIRSLKPDDSITVVVSGAPNSGTARTMLYKSSGGGGSSASAKFEKDVIIHGPDGAGKGETVLTVRAKKSDVDAFAKGDLNQEAFAKKASIAVY